MCKKLMLVVAVMFLGATVGMAVQMDSANFANKVEGDVLPSTMAGWAYSGTLPETDYMSVSGGILSIDTLTLAGGQTSYYDYAAGSGIGYANGFTCEFRLKVNSAVKSGDVNTGLWLAAGRVTLTIMDDVIKHRGGGDDVIYTADNTDGFHTYRLTIAPGMTSWDLYRDGALVIDDRIEFSPWNWFFFGDGTGAGPDLDVDVDYVRWDASGAFEPIPEPATMSLLGLGLLGLLRNRK